jgi:hypothetical protein
MKKVLVLVLSLVMFGTACSTAWVSTLDSILSAAAPALIDILQIVSAANGKPMNSELAAKINTDGSAIKTLAADFAKSSSLVAPSVCSQLNAAIGTYQQDQQTVLQLAQVSDQATQTKIVLLSTLVEDTVGAITAVIPSCQSTAQGRFTTAAPPLSVKTFTTTYNAILVTKTGNAAVDVLTPKLVIHRHSKFVRVVTVGRLQ